MPILMLKRAFLFFFFTTAITHAQLEDLGAIASDLIFLTEEYVSPAAEASVYQSSGGWYTSAKRKELWDLEVSIQGNVLFIPKKAIDFLIDESDLQNIRIKGAATTAITPTALGNDGFVELEGTIDGSVFEFDSPQGINESYLRHAQIQTSLGLWEGTSLIARYSPKIKINKTYFQLFGLGLQHNISQWISPIKESSFSLSGLVTYSSYSVSDTFTAVVLPVGVLNSVIVDGESFMFSLVASKQFNKFNISSAIGLASSNFEFEVGGEGNEVLSILNQALANLNKSQTNFKADLGVDYSFYDFSVNAMLTFGSFSNLLLGINYNI